MPTPFPPTSDEHLNPGIARLVNALRAAGFDTRDSGDGVTKHFDCDPGYPYVHIVVADPRQLVAEAKRLVAWLAAHGVTLQDLDEEGTVPHVEACYAPASAEYPATLTVVNVLDAHLTWPEGETAPGDSSEPAAVYVAAIHHEPGSSYGVSFPDFPGCITAADTLEAAIAEAPVALDFHIRGMRKDGEAIPQPGAIQAITADPDFADALLVLVRPTPAVAD